MEAEFIEKYDKLSDMSSGDIAISKDRKKIFVCGWHRTKEMDKGELVILNINNLCDQYTDSRDMSQPIRILTRGNKINLVV